VRGLQLGLGIKVILAGGTLVVAAAGSGAVAWKTIKATGNSTNTISNDDDDDEYSGGGGGGDDDEVVGNLDGWVLTVLAVGVAMGGLFSDYHQRQHRRRQKQRRRQRSSGSTGGDGGGDGGGGGGDGVAQVALSWCASSASLWLVGLGLVGVAWSRPSLDWLAWTRAGGSPIVAPLAFPSLDDWWQGLYRAALPQFPVTLLNAVIATSKMAEDLYPAKDRRLPLSVSGLSLSIGLTNLTGCGLGHFPSCHGCGGFAGQHRFGARSGSAMVLLGCVKMALAASLGRTLLSGVLGRFPSSVVGVLLAVAGAELAARSMVHQLSRKGGAVALLGAAVALSPWGTGIAFAVSLAAALAVTWWTGEPM
jgi:hypothetical protein